MMKKRKEYLRIVYEDENIIVVNKKDKLLTIRDPKHPFDDNLYSQVSYYVKKNNPINKIFIVHRLDKDTSGLVIFAKNIKYKNILQKEFENKDVVRIYECVCSDKINGELPIVLKNYLFTDKFNNVFVSKRKTDTLAITEILKCEYDKDKNESKLIVKIDTGKKNQIRCQLANISHPIVGNKKYNGKKAERLKLNFYHLEFPNLKKLLKQSIFITKKIF